MDALLFSSGVIHEFCKNYPTRGRTGNTGKSSLSEHVKPQRMLQVLFVAIEHVLTANLR